MSKQQFKVGDRVRVVSEGRDMHGMTVPIDEVDSQDHVQPYRIGQAWYKPGELQPAVPHPGTDAPSVGADERRERIATEGCALPLSLEDKVLEEILDGCIDAEQAAIAFVQFQARMDVAYADALIAALDG